MYKLQEFCCKIRSECEALRICHELATGSKHFRLREKQAQTVSNTDTKFFQSGGILQPALCPALQPALAPAFGGYMVNGLVIKLRSGKVSKPMEIFQQAVTYWDNLLDDEGG